MAAEDEAQNARSTAAETYKRKAAGTVFLSADTAQRIDSLVRPFTQRFLLSAGDANRNFSRGAAENVKYR